MRRMGKPHELDRVIILPCSPAGFFFTGSDIRVDGETQVAFLDLKLSVNLTSGLF